MSGEKNREERYRKKLRLRFTTSLGLTVFGALMLWLGIYVQSSNFASEGGFYIGTGCGILGAGIARAVRTRRLLSDDKRRKAKELEEYDERNLFLHERTMTYSGYGIVVFLYLGSILLVFVNEIVAQTFQLVLAVYSILIVVINLVLRKQN